MPNEPDHRVRELGLTCLRLRSDLTFTPQRSGRQPYYLIEDPLNSRYFRLGYAEYAFVSLLDGSTTIQAAFAQLCAVLPDHHLTEADVSGLCRWLIDADLAHTEESSQARNLTCQAARRRQRELATWNPLVFRVPLCRPDRFFGKLNSVIGWIYSPAAAVPWLALVIVAAYFVFADWDRFTSSAQGVFAPGNWLWLIGTWGVLKLFHETAHGVVCRRHGGNVGDAGLLFVAFAPLAYVDVTASWRFQSRWRRIHVAAAGMYIELFVAAAMAIIWSQTAGGWLNHLCFNVIMMASLTTIVFNANPLMKFDGYYILSDALDLPNLYVNGQAYLRSWGRRYLFGVPTALPARPMLDAALICVYGWLSFAWRIVVCASLVVTAAALFHGAGMALAAFSVLAWLGVPALRLGRYFVRGNPGEQPNRIRFLATTGIAAVACIAVFGFVRWPGMCQAPAVVEYAPHTVVRAANSGFVREIHVVPGQLVSVGELLVVLENRELTRELAELDVQIRQSQLRIRQFEQRGKLAAQQAEVESRQALETQLAEKRTQVEQLEVRAASAGKVLTRNLSAIMDTYVTKGDEILSLGDDSQKELRLSISQDDLDAYSARVGESLCVDVPQHPLWYGRLDKVIPRATLEPPHPALAAVNGGRLPVKPVTRREDTSSEESLELFAPRFTGIVSLDEVHSRQLHSGQRARVTCRPFDESIGQHLYATLEGWVRRRLKRG